MTIAVKKDATVPYSCEQMYQLVDDVEHYADFLPHCTQAIVHHRDEDEVKATIELSAMGMKKSFTTCNRLQQNKMIEIRLVDGPFSHLEGFWRFDPSSKPNQPGCHISFALEFEFNSRMVAMVLGPMFGEATKQVFDAFHERAKVVYGEKE